MEIILVIIGASSIGFATIGFLLILFVLDNNVLKKLRERNTAIVDMQKGAYADLEKSNYYLELAKQISCNIEILKAVNANEVVLKRMEKEKTVFLQNLAMYGINARIRLKKINEVESDDLIQEIRELGNAELMKRYESNAKEVSSETKRIGEEHGENKKEYLKWEWIKNISWYGCLLFQSAGIILNVLSVVFKNYPKT